MGGGGTLNPMIHDDSGDGHVDANLETRFVERSAKIIKLGAVGYGEVAVLHLAPYRGQQFELVNGDHPLFLKLADITARHDVVIDVHFDMVVEDMETPEWLPQPLNPPRLKRNLVAFERFLSHNRNARIVWAHLGSDFVGFRTPKRMRRMLRDHPNLYMSLRLGPGRVRSNHPIGRTGIKGPWMRLFQDFPDRFVIGTDQIFSIAGGSLSNQHAKQRRVVRERTNTFLSYLPNDLARKIAHENAMRIYKITM
ncbi:MAG: amidohydrolase family protein [Magnetovibrio sp.]|nr:amidohydrolase family protein [Magnetovibrio sp.]